MLVRSVTLSALAAILLTLVPSSASAAGVARVILKQSGATLMPGQSVVFEAVAVDKRGNEVKGARIRFKSSKPGTVQVQADGTATAGNSAGEAIITASSGKKKATADVDVVTSPDLTLFKGSVNHVLAHDGWVYWTENTGRQVRLRKIAKSGGLIVDLASEPRKDKRALTVSYIHLRVVGDRVLFTRQTNGFFSHFSIVSVSVEGGDRKTLLKEDISAEPLSAGGWNVVGRTLLVSVFDPKRLRLPENTRLAALDLDSGEWSPAVRGVFQPERVFIVAVDNQFAYLRGTVEDDRTQILRLDPAVGTGSLTELLSFADEDDDSPQAGATDGVNLYFFSEGPGNTHRLLSLPLTGGDPTMLDSGPLSLGLTLRDGNLYYAIDGKRLVRQSVAGGNKDTLLEGLDPDSTIAGIGVDNDSLYPVTKAGKVSTIRRIAR